MIKFQKIIFILFISACSLNSSSSLWTKHQKLEREKSLNIKQLNKKKEVLKNEINPGIKIKLNYLIGENDLNNDLTNNNGVTNYSGELKRISKYNF